MQGALNLQDSFLEGDNKVNAHFGHAIASVGDLNADGYNGNFFPNQSAVKNLLKISSF